MFNLRFPRGDYTREAGNWKRSGQYCHLPAFIPRELIKQVTGSAFSWISLIIAWGNRLPSFLKSLE